MIERTTIEQLAARIGALLPTDARVLRDEFRANVRSLLEVALNRMDLVTRAEFDVQRALLERTREKLDRLERELAALEARRGS